MRALFEDKNNRYMTSGIAEELHLEIAVRLWSLIDDLREDGAELDYLQVFHLMVRNGVQLVRHTQELHDYNELSYLLLYTGVRVTELVGIKISEIDRFTNSLTVKGKGGKIREISLWKNVYR